MISNDDLDDGSGAVAVTKDVVTAATEPVAPVPFAVLPTTTRPIAKRITILWVSPHDPPEKCIASWKTHHPENEGWDVRVMSNLDGWLHQDLMDALRQHAHEPDWSVMEIARLSVLSSLGGFVVAADSFCDRGLSSGTTQNPDKPQTDFFNAADCLLSYADEKAGAIGSVFVAGVRSSEFSNRCIEALDRYCRENVWNTREGAIALAAYVGTKLLTEVASVMLREPATRTENKLKVLPAKMFAPLDAKGSTTNGAVCPVYGRAQHGKERGINQLRKWPCQCQGCRSTFSSLRPPWG